MESLKISDTQLLLREKVNSLLINESVKDYVTTYTKLSEEMALKKINEIHDIKVANMNLKKYKPPKVFVGIKQTKQQKLKQENLKNKITQENAEKMKKLFDNEEQINITRKNNPINCCILCGKVKILENEVCVAAACDALYYKDEICSDPKCGIYQKEYNNTKDQ